MQQRLLLVINVKPGIRYRELLRLTNSSNGVLSHHVYKLEKMQLVVVDRKSRVTRFFARNISKEFMDMLGLLRNRASFEIIKIIFEFGPLSQQEVAMHTSKSTSTISWHMKKLLEANMICIKNNNVTPNDDNLGGVNIQHTIKIQHKKVHLYDLLNRNLVKDLMLKSNKFIDRTVDNYSQIIDSF